jgi:SPP1 gp7 family putative phage head morphogenesis protein
VVFNQRFAFQTAPEQLESFESWLREQQGARFGDRADPYWEEFIQEAYEKGAGRAFDDTNQARRALAQTAEDIEFLQGSKEQFLRDAFAQPETREKISLLASRTFGDLRAVNGQMAALLNRTLSAGLAEGMNPRVIARTMLEGIGLNRDRAQVIARTEIIRAHAEGQLDAMERMGVERVGVMVEWSAAGDDRVCPLCRPLDGVVMKISEARGLIPRHPNCRCAHVPAQVGEPADTTRRVNYGEGPLLIRQRKSKAEIEAAFRRSVGAERKKGSLAEKRRRSKWVGADRAIAKKRPKRTVGK